MFEVKKLMTRRVTCDLFRPQGTLEAPMEKAPVSVACGGESPLDGICLSESDKTAVLTLIREEVTASLLCPLRAPPLCQAHVPAGGFLLCWFGFSLPS